MYAYPGIVKENLIQRKMEANQPTGAVLVIKGLGESHMNSSENQFQVFI